MNDIDTQNYAKFQTHLDSLLAKVSFSAFEREAIRLTMIEARQDKAKIDDQIQFMENMRLNRRQKAQLGEQGFYIYLAQGKIKKAARMMDLVKTYGTPQQLHPLEIQYSILLKKEAKYIDELKERLKKLEDSSGKHSGKPESERRYVPVSDRSAVTPITRTSPIRRSGQNWPWRI